MTCTSFQKLPNWSPCLLNLFSTYYQKDVVHTWVISRHSSARNPPTGSPFSLNRSQRNYCVSQALRVLASHLHSSHAGSCVIPQVAPLDLTLPSSLPGTLSPGIFTLIPFLPSRRLSQSLSRQLTSNSNPFFHHFPSPGSFSLLTSRYYRIHVTSCFFSFSHPRQRSLCLTHCWNPEQCLQCFRIVKAFSPNSNDVDTTSTLLILATEET